MTVSVENLHKSLLDNVSASSFLNMSAGGTLLGYTNNSETYSGTLINQTAALFYLKAIE